MASKAMLDTIKEHFGLDDSGLVEDENKDWVFYIFNGNWSIKVIPKKKIRDEKDASKFTQLMTSKFYYTFLTN